MFVAIERRDGSSDMLVFEDWRTQRLDTLLAFERAKKDDGVVSAVASFGDNDVRAFRR